MMNETDLYLILIFLQLLELFMHAEIKLLKFQSLSIYFEEKQKKSSSNRFGVS